MKRRPGSVFQRKQDGRWAAAVTLPGGKRVTRYLPPGTPNPERAAYELLARLMTEASTGDLAAPSELTVERYLADYTKRANRHSKPSTIYDRSRTVRLINTSLGSTRLDRLTPQQVQRWLDGVALSQRSRIKGLQLLRAACAEAVALGMLTRNPAAPVKLPRMPQRPKGTAWTAEQARSFLMANADTPHAHIWRLALQTGARIGELLALRLEDIDGQQLHIRRTVTRSQDSGSRTATGPPKTAAADRYFPLPPDALTHHSGPDAAARVPEPVPWLARWRLSLLLGAGRAAAV